MAKITWRWESWQEIAEAKTVFEIYERRKFIAYHNGKRVREFEAKLGSLTFKPMPTAYDRIMEDD